MSVEIHDQMRDALRIIRESLADIEIDVGVIGEHYDRFERIDILELDSLMIGGNLRHIVESQYRISEQKQKIEGIIDSANSMRMEMVKKVYDKNG